MRYCGNFLIALLFLPVSAIASSDGAIRSARDLDALLSSGKHQSRDFELTGVIVSPCGPITKNFFLSDGTCIVRLVDMAFWPNRRFSPGDTVMVAGRTSWRGSYANADCHAIEILGHGDPPPPEPSTISRLLTRPTYPFRHVLVRANVRDVFRDDIDPNFAFVMLADEENALCASLNCDDDTLPGLQRLVGAEVEAEGLIRTDNAPSFGNGGRVREGLRKILGPLLALSGTDSLHVVKPPPEDPFDVPSLSSLTNFWAKDLLKSGRCRASGRVISAARSNGFVLRESSGQIVNIDLSSGRKPHVGESIDAVGIPTTDLYHVNLVRAIWRNSSSEFPAKAEEPAETSPKALLADTDGRSMVKMDKHGTLVRLAGTVRSLPPVGGGDNRISLESDGYVISVVAEPGVAPFAEVGLGYQVEVTGTCIMDVETWSPDMVFPSVKGVSVAVRGAHDVRILGKPSWMTAGRLLAAVCVMALLGTGVLIWNVFLRAIVARKSRQLLREQAMRLEETFRVDERIRLATELHDTIAQNMSGISLQLDAAARLADVDHEGMKSVISLASKSLLACRKELRQCLCDLRSQTLNEKDMDLAVARSLRQRIGSATLTSRFDVPRKMLTDSTAHAILRILGELASNAVQHGRATAIQVEGRIDGCEMMFSCTDNGSGFDPSAAPGAVDGHFGLQGIRDRIRRYNGSMRICSSPGKGTKVFVTLRIERKFAKT